MIPIWHAGEFIHCGPQQKKTHLRHCPVCSDCRQVKAVWSGRPAPELPVLPLVECPVCGSAAGLWRLLDRRLS